MDKPLGHQGSDDFGGMLEVAASGLRDEDMLLSSNELTIDQIHNLSSKLPPGECRGELSTGPDARCSLHQPRRRTRTPTAAPANPPPLLHPPAAAPQPGVPSYHSTFDSELSGGMAMYGSGVASPQVPPITHIGDFIPRQRPSSSTTSSEAQRRVSSPLPEDDADSGWVLAHQSARVCRMQAAAGAQLPAQLPSPAPTSIDCHLTCCSRVSPLPKMSSRKVTPTKAASGPAASGASSRSGSRPTSGGGSVAGSSSATGSTATSKSKLPRWVLWVEVLRLRCHYD